jgi:hypothetical protein
MRYQILAIETADQERGQATRFPKPRAHVRFMPGASKKCLHGAAGRTASLEPAKPSGISPTERRAEIR